MRVTLFELNTHVHKIDTEGPVARNVNIEIFDRNFEIQSRNKEGLIGIKGSNLCIGYLDKELWEGNIKDGYFVTSDRGYLDADGFLVFKGRDDDVINSNGALVHPDEIENKILRVWPNLVFSVVGIDDPKKIKDSLIALCIQGETTLTLSDLTEKLPDVDSNILPHFIINFDILPMTRTGKVNRNQLRVLAYEKASTLTEV